MPLEVVTIKDAADADQNITVDQSTIGKTQVVKVGFGALDADPTLVSASDPMPVTGTLSGITNALPAGDNNIGNVDVATLPALPAGTNNIGDVDVLTVPADPFGTNADAAVLAGATGSIQAKLRRLSADLDAIKTAVEIIDNTVAGAEMQIDIVSGNVGVTGSVAVTGPLTDAELRAVAVPVSGTFFQATQPVSGTVTATGPVTDAQLRATAVPVSGTVTANLAAGANNIGDVDVLTVPVDPFGANADAVVAAGAVGSIQAKLRRLTTDIDAIKTSVAAATPAGTNNIGDVDVLTLPPIPAGTNNIGDVDVLTLPPIPAGTNNIGDVDILTVPADPFGANADAAIAAGAAGSLSAKLRLMTSQLNAIQTAVETIENTVAGSELQVDVISGGIAGTEYAEDAVVPSVIGPVVQARGVGNVVLPLKLDAAGNLYVAMAGDTVFTVEGGTDPLPVGGNTKVFQSVPAVTNGAYTANDVIGGLITITNAFGTRLSGILQSVGVFFEGNHAPHLHIYYFNADPVQSTADNGAFAWSTADDGLCFWMQEVLTADYKTIPGATTRRFAPILPGYPGMESTTQDLWIYVVTLDAVTLTSTGDLHLFNTIVRD